MRRVSPTRSLKTVDQSIQRIQLLLGKLHQLRILLEALYCRGARNRQHERQARIGGQAAHPVDGDLAGSAALFASKLLDLGDEFEVVLELGWLESGVGRDEAELLDVFQGLVLAGEELFVMSVCTSALES